MPLEPLLSGRKRIPGDSRPASSRVAITGLMLGGAALITSLTGAKAADFQNVDCASYARSYADAHVTSDPGDLSVADGGMRGAVVGGAWEGPSGARRGARAGAALSVLDSLGNYPSGWRGLYDMAYRLCRNSQSSVNHRPSTLGDPSYRPAQPSFGQLEPPAPPRPRAPLEPLR